MDQNLIIEAQSRAAGEIHDVKNICHAYQLNCQFLIIEPNCADILAAKIRTEKILRVFVNNKRLNNPISFKSIISEFSQN